MNSRLATTILTEIHDEGGVNARRIEFIKQLTYALKNFLDENNAYLNRTASDKVNHLTRTLDGVIGSWNDVIYDDGGPYQKIYKSEAALMEVVDRRLIELRLENLRNDINELINEKSIYALLREKLKSINDINVKDIKLSRNVNEGDESFATSQLPYIPVQVDLDDLDDNQRLLTIAQVAALKADPIMAVIEQARIKKNVLQENKNLGEIKYDVAKVGEKYYAIYRGFTQGKQLATTHDDSVIVKLAQDIDTGEWVAMKVIKPSKDPSDTRDSQQLQHELQIELKGLEQAQQLKASYSRENKAGDSQSEILMTLVPGSNLTTIAMGGYKPASRWLDIAIGSLEAVHDAHKKGLLHRDIKDTNIMYGRGEAYLVDFGQAVFVPGEKLELQDNLIYGTPEYRAPEVNTCLYNEKTEVFALGVTIAMFLGLATRMNGDLEVIANPGEFQLPNRISNEVTRHAVYQLITRMIDANPEERPTLPEAIGALRVIRDEQPNIISDLVRIGYVDIHEFSNAKPEQKDEMLKALKYVDEVCLVGRKNDEDITRWVKVAHAIEVQGLSVSNQRLLCDEKYIPQAIIQSRQELEKSSSAISNLVYVTPNEMTQASIDQFHQQSVVCIKVSGELTDGVEYNNKIDDYIQNMNVTDVNYNKAFTHIRRQYEHSESVEAKEIENVMLVLDNDKAKGQLTYGILFEQCNNIALAVEREDHRKNISTFHESLPDDVVEYKKIKDEVGALLTNMDATEMSNADAWSAYAGLEFKFHQLILQERMDYTLASVTKSIHDMNTELKNIEVSLSNNQYTIADSDREDEIIAAIKSSNEFIASLGILERDLRDANSDSQLHEISETYDHAIQTAKIIPQRVFSEHYLSPMDDFGNNEEKLSHLLFKLNEDVLYHQKLMRMNMGDMYTSWELDQSKHLRNIVADANFTDYNAAAKMYNTILRVMDVFNFFGECNTFINNPLVSSQYRDEMLKVSDDLANLHIDVDEAIDKYNAIKLDDEINNMYLKIDFAIQHYKNSGDEIKSEDLQRLKESAMKGVSGKDILRSAQDGYKGIVKNDIIIPSMNVPENYHIPPSELSKMDEVQKIDHIRYQLGIDALYYTNVLRSGLASQDTRRQLDWVNWITEHLDSKSYAQASMIHDGILNLTRVLDLTNRLEVLESVLPNLSENRRNTFKELHEKLDSLSVGVDDAEREFGLLSKQLLEHEVHEYKKIYADLFMRLVKIGVASEMLALKDPSEKIESTNIYIIQKIYKFLEERLNQMKVFEDKLNNDTLTDKDIQIHIKDRNKMYYFKDKKQFELSDFIYSTDHILQQINLQLGADAIQLKVNDEMLRLVSGEQSSRESQMHELNAKVFPILLRAYGGVSPYPSKPSKEMAEKIMQTAMQDLNKIIEEPQRYGWKLGIYSNYGTGDVKFIPISADKFGLDSVSGDYNLFVETLNEAHSKISKVITALTKSDAEKPLPIFKVVLDVLKDKTKFDPSKTVARAFIDGSMPSVELYSLNASTEKFPHNSDKFKLPEGGYSRQEVMMNFVRTIGPFLSDKILYEMTHKLAGVETRLSDKDLALLEVKTDAKLTYDNLMQIIKERAGQFPSVGDGAAYRNSTLGKCFLLYELERHSEDIQNGILPPVFLSHMNKYILPLAVTGVTNWGDPEKFFKMFISFNLGDNVMLNPEVAKNIKAIVDVYEQLKGFDPNTFDVNDLNDQAPKKADEFPTYLLSLERSYADLTSRVNPLDEFKPLLEAYTQAALALENYVQILDLNTKKTNALNENISEKSRQEIRQLYTQLNALHEKAESLWPTVSNSYVTASEAHVNASHHYGNIKNNAERVLKSSEPYIKEINQEKYDKDRLVLVEQFKSFQEEYKQLINENPKDIRTIALIELKYIDLTDKLSEIIQLGREVNEAKGATKNKDTLKQMELFAQHHRDFLDNVPSYLSAIDNQKVVAIREARTNYLLREIPLLQERLQYLSASPYADAANKLQCTELSSELIKLRTVLSGYLGTGVLDAKIIEKFDAIEEKANNNHVKISQEQYAELNRRINKECRTEIGRYTAMAKLKSSKAADLAVDQLVAIYSNNIDVLESRLVQLEERYVAYYNENKKNHHILIELDVALKDIQSKLDNAERNFDIAVKVMPLLNEVIINMHVEHKDKWDDYNRKLYASKDVFTSTGYADVVSTGLKRVVLHNLINAKNDPVKMATFFPLIYDVNRDDIKEEFKKIFIGDPKMNKQFLDLVNEAIPLFKLAPLVARGESIEAKYQNMLSSTDSEMKRFESQYHGVMAKLKPLVESEDDETHEMMRGVYPYNYEAHSQFIADQAKKFDDLMARYKTFKNKISSNDNRNLTQDISDLNDLVADSNKFRKEMLATLEHKKSVVHIVDSALNQAYAAHDEINKIVKSLSEVEKLKNIRPEIGEIEKKAEKANELINSIKGFTPETINNFTTFDALQSEQGKAYVEQLNQLVAGVQTNAGLSGGSTHKLHQYTKVQILPSKTNIPGYTSVILLPINATVPADRDPRALYLLKSACNILLMTKNDDVVAQNSDANHLRLYREGTGASAQFVYYIDDKREVIQIKDWAMRQILTDNFTQHFELNNSQLSDTILAITSERGDSQESKVMVYSSKEENPRVLSKEDYSLFTRNNYNFTQKQEVIHDADDVAKIVRVCGYTHIPDMDEDTLYLQKNAGGSVLVYTSQSIQPTILDKEKKEALAVVLDKANQGISTSGNSSLTSTIVELRNQELISKVSAICGHISLLEDLRVLRFFANFPENFEKWENGDESIDNFIKRNADAISPYHRLFQYFSNGADTTQNLSTSRLQQLLGDRLKEVILRVATHIPEINELVTSVINSTEDLNKQRMKVEASIAKFDKELELLTQKYPADKVKLYEESIQLRNNINARFDYLGNAKFRVENLYAPDLAHAKFNNVFMLPEKPHEDEVTPNTFVMVRKDGQLTAYWRDKDEKIQTKSLGEEQVQGIIHKLSKAKLNKDEADKLIKDITLQYGFTLEQEIKDHQAKLQVERQLLEKVSETANIPREKPEAYKQAKAAQHAPVARPDIPSYLDELKAKARVVEPDDDKAAVVKVKPVPPPKPRKTFVEAMQATRTIPIPPPKSSKPQSIICDKQMFDFIANFARVNSDGLSHCTFSNDDFKITYNPEDKQKLDKLVIYYGKTKSLLETLNVCLEHYGPSDEPHNKHRDNHIYAAIEKTIKTISTQECDLMKEIKELEAINRKHKPISRFFVDNTLAKEIASIKKELRKEGENEGKGKKEEVIENKLNS